MTNEQDKPVKLPRFVIDSELLRALEENNRDFLAVPSPDKFIVFEWSDVRFFDDYTLLKLIFLQRQMRAAGARVRNRGFRNAQLHPNLYTVMRQLWAVGLPELTASGHLFSSTQIRTVIEDETEILDSDPLLGDKAPATTTAVIPLLCCHDRKHFTPGSREEKQLDTFVRTCLRPKDSNSLAWDLIENRQFRHLLLQQLRRNVREHTRHMDRPVIGLALARVWTSRSLSDEWGLPDKLQDELRTLWQLEPVSELLRTLGPERGILQVSVVDDGPGIPQKLDAVHSKLVVPAPSEDLFTLRKSIRYRDADFEKEFAAPALWPDEKAKARLIAFATHAKGTSKTDRAPEIKGLQYLREDAVIKGGGAVLIESDGFAISGITPARQYGLPGQVHLRWCRTGGTGVCLAVPMSAIEASSHGRKGASDADDRRAGMNVVPGTERISITKLLTESAGHRHSSSFEPQDISRCVATVLDNILLPEPIADIAQLRKMGILIIDWGELNDSKRLFHHLLVGIAKGLAASGTYNMRPFIFADLPHGLCALLETAIGEYSTLDNPTLVCAFTAEDRNPFWLGLQGPDSLSEDLRGHMTCKLRRTLTDRRENRTVAFHRNCLARLLDQATSVYLSDDSVLECVDREHRPAILRSAAFSRLETLVRRCPLVRARTRDVYGDKTFTNRFEPVFRPGEIIAVVRSLFLEEFSATLTSSPVCFTPARPNEGIQLPHSTRVVSRYFRADALVDSPIAPELTQELKTMALNIAHQLPTGRIDWVVSCTSPLHWFVHRIVDGMAESGIIASHYVFPSFEAISSSLDNVNMRAGETVLVFTDVIASGQTVFRMAKSLVDQFHVNIAGLIALADTRSLDDRKTVDLEHAYGGRIYPLYSNPEPIRKDLDPTYYVHPETAVPKRAGAPAEDFFEGNFAGVGPLVVKHAFFSTPKRTLDQMKKIGAVRFGHFQHGSHHSEIFVDVEKVLACRELRDLMVTALFRYIVMNDIRLVLYPSHSSAYLLADDLKQRANSEESSVRFIMACRTFKGNRGTSYALTPFSPNADADWPKYSNSAVLILDDAVCSGSTVESIIAELVRVDTNYYDHNLNSPERTPQPNFAVHVVAFLNRLPRVSGDFWAGLSRVTSGRVTFSAFLTMPLATDSADLCAQCHLLKRLARELESPRYCFYAKEFMSWWSSCNALVSSREGRLNSAPVADRFTSAAALRLAGYISALERHAYSAVKAKLFAENVVSTEAESTAVRVHVRSRAGFLLGELESVSGDAVVGLVKELNALLDLACDRRGVLMSLDDVLEILKTLTVRYLKTRPSKAEVEGIVACLLSRLAPAFGSRLLLGGVACVLERSLSWFETPSRDAWNAIRRTLRSALPNAPSPHPSFGDSRWAIDWLEVYLTEEGCAIVSEGDAVRKLALYAQQGRPNHFYGRLELDRLREEIERPPAAVALDRAVEVVLRVFASCDVFNQMLVATRAVRSRCSMSEAALAGLQSQTQSNVEQMRSLCKVLLSDQPSSEGTGRNDHQKLLALFSDTFDLWFGENYKPKPAQVIGYFLPRLTDTVELAWSGFRSQRTTPVVFKHDTWSLNARRFLRVIIDPQVLATTVHQLLDNIDRLSTAPDGTNVSWSVSDSPETGRDGAGTRVDLVVSNDATPPVAPSTLRLNGLETTRMRLSEYGGDLVVLDAPAPWTFRVAIRMKRWMEIQDEDANDREPARNIPAS